MIPPSGGPAPLQAIRRLSAGALFLGLMTVSVLCAILLTAAILVSAGRTNAAALDRIGAGLLSRLENGGASAVALAVAQVDESLSPARDMFEVAIWRRQGGVGQGGAGQGENAPAGNGLAGNGLAGNGLAGNGLAGNGLAGNGLAGNGLGAGWRLLRESAPGAAAMLAPVPVGARMSVRAEGGRFEATALDVAAASAGWETPYADIRIAYAMRLPTEATRAARRTLGAIWAGYALALCVGALLHANHRARYRAGLGHISEVLAAFSEGRTAVRVDPGLPAPELERVGAQINAVLPRIEQLMAGLRYVSAHLAHEIRTPLQAIHGDVARLARTGAEDERRRIEAAIHKTIDQADARLQSVMRLFRLQAGERVELWEGVDLGALVEEQVYDLQDLLEGGGRSLATALAPGVLIRCNPQLMEVLVINLLSNAAKYSPPRARIELELTTEEPAPAPATGLPRERTAQDPAQDRMAQANPAQAALVREGSRFRLRIGNSGGSFPDALRADAFSRFTRGGGQDAVAGFGLGLSTVAGIVAQHGFTAEILPQRDDGEGAPWAEVIVRGPCGAAPA